MSDGKQTILVTGATGFVGCDIVGALSPDDWSIRRAVRHVTGEPTEVVVGSLGPNTNWDAALDGVDAVVHLSARVHHPNEKYTNELYRQVNTGGTLQLAARAAAAGVKRFIYLSSVLVNGSATNGRMPFRKTDAVKPRGVYGSSKAAAEAGLGILNKHGMSVSVISPPLIYGPGAQGNFRLLASAVARGVLLPFATIDNKRAFVGVDNLCSFIEHRLRSENEQDYYIFMIADNEQISTPGFIREIAAAMGRRARLFPYPASGLRLLLKSAGKSEATESLMGSMQIDVSKSFENGWRPKLTMREGSRLALGESHQSIN